MSEQVVVTDPATDLAVRLSDLWFAERCGWTLSFDEGAGTADPWCVGLSWVEETSNTHRADWIEYTWQFYGATVAEALGDAVEWCEGLLPFEARGACDGTGAYVARRDEGDRECEECGGTGLARL